MTKEIILPGLTTENTPNNPPLKMAVNNRHVVS